MPFWNRNRGSGSGNSSQPRAGFSKRVYPYNLRWILFFTCFIGIIWALAMGVQQIQNRSSDNRPTKLQVFDIVTGIMYFSIALIEFYVFVVAAIHNAKMGKLLLVLAPVGVAVTFATQVLMVIVHYAMKSDKINQCIENYTTIPSIYIDGKVSTVTQEQASAWCDDAWDRGSWSVFAWLVLALLVALFFASMAMQYARQLADPSLVRQRFNGFNRNANNGNQAQAYPLQPQGPGFYPPPPLQHQDSNSWMVPPYPGPPQSQGQGQELGEGSTERPPYDKSAYQPRAAWANDAPDADPFRHDAEERAWEQARSNGVTAHLTGQGSPPPTGTGTRAVRSVENPSGFIVPNREEEEAWLEARNTGVTAHLTGGGVGGAAKNPRV